jgi:hypothetical protein
MGTASPEEDRPPIEKVEVLVRFGASAAWYKPAQLRVMVMHEDAVREDRFCCDTEEQGREGGVRAHPPPHCM